MQQFKMEEATSMSELEDIRRKNREVNNLQREPDQSKLSDEEYINYKIDNWDNGMNCSDYDKGVVISWLVKMVRLINKDLEELKKK